MADKNSLEHLLNGRPLSLVGKHVSDGRECFRHTVATLNTCTHKHTHKRTHTQTYTHAHTNIHTQTNTHTHESHTHGRATQTLGSEGGWLECGWRPTR